MSCPSFAIITPSFILDYERCSLLAKSVLKYVDPNVTHYILVDQRDEKLFSSLASSRTHIITVESLLPGWLFRMPLSKKWWLSLKTLPIRNWILQQIVKLSVDLKVNADVLIFIDSDVFFVKHYNPANYIKDGKVPLFREYGQELIGEMNSKWHNVAYELLGLEAKERYLTNYVGNLITWKRDNLIALRKYVEERSHRGFVQTVGSLVTFSEYVLYGSFVESILKEDSGHYHYNTINSLCYWSDQKLDRSGLDELKKKLNDDHVAVMVSAKSRTPIDSIAEAFDLKVA